MKERDSKAKEAKTNKESENKTARKARESKDKEARKASENKEKETRKRKARGSKKARKARDSKDIAKIDVDLSANGIYKVYKSPMTCISIIPRI